MADNTVRKRPNAKTAACIEAKDPLSNATDGPTTPITKEVALVCLLVVASYFSVPGNVPFTLSAKEIAQQTTTVFHVWW
jgi:hypothetical protein